MHGGISFGPSDDDDHEDSDPEQASIDAVDESDLRIRLEDINIKGGDSAQGDDDGDEDTPEYTYGCVRRITDIDGEKRPCPGNVQTTKDYGDRFYRECPSCEVEHPMEKVSENDG